MCCSAQTIMKIRAFFCFRKICKSQNKLCRWSLQLCGSPYAAFAPTDFLRLRFGGSTKLLVRMSSLSKIFANLKFPYWTTMSPPLPIIFKGRVNLLFNYTFLAVSFAKIVLLCKYIWSFANYSALNIMSVKIEMMNFCLFWKQDVSNITEKQPQCAGLMFLQKR